MCIKVSFDPCILQRSYEEHRDGKELSMITMQRKHTMLMAILRRSKTNFQREYHSVTGEQDLKYHSVLGELQRAHLTLKLMSSVDTVVDSSFAHELNRKDWCA